MGTQKTITIKGDGIRKEALATAVAITPGYLVERTSAGTVQAHSTAGGPAQSAVAVEDDLQGRPISTDYAASSLVQYNVFQKGEEFLARIANGASAIVDGDKLVSAGDGTLKKMAEQSSHMWNEEYVVAIAQEDCDMSGSSGEDDNGTCIAEVM